MVSSAWSVIGLPESCSVTSSDNWATGFRSESPSPVSRSPSTFNRLSVESPSSRELSSGLRAKLRMVSRVQAASSPRPLPVTWVSIRLSCSRALSRASSGRSASVMSILRIETAVTAPWVLVVTVPSLPSAAGMLPREVSNANSSGLIG